MTLLDQLPIVPNDVGIHNTRGEPPLDRRKRPIGVDSSPH